MTTMGMPGAGFLPGVMPDHAAAILVPLVLPAAIWLFLGVVRLAARADLGIAQRFARGYADASALTRVAAFLLALAGAIHLALVPAHLAPGPVLAHPFGVAHLFALDGVAFLGVGMAAFVWARWRPWAAALLVATLAAYLFYLGTGREEADLVGTTTYLIELIALGIIWIARVGPSDREIPDALLGEVGARSRRGELTGVGRP